MVDTNVPVCFGLLCVQWGDNFPFEKMFCATSEIAAEWIQFVVQTQFFFFYSYKITNECVYIDMNWKAGI